jgi:hypothetical protein
MKYIFQSTPGYCHSQDQLCTDLIHSFEPSTTFITAGRFYFRFFSLFHSLDRSTYLHSDIWRSSLTIMISAKKAILAGYLILCSVGDVLSFPLTPRQQAISDVDILQFALTVNLSHSMLFHT